MNLVELTWKQIQALDRDTPVVFPIAAIEQHGYHLPVWTDSLLLGEIVKRVTERLPTQVLFAPLMWLGNSHHHLDFHGTLSAAPRTYLDLLVGLADNMLHHGFRRIVFLNGHGGNDVPGRQAISMVMRIAPHLVGDYLSADPIPHGRGFEPGNRGWVTQDRSDIGHIGWPQQASVQKGEALLDRFSTDVTRWLERVVDWDGSSWDG